MFVCLCFMAQKNDLEFYFKQGVRNNLIFLSLSFFAAFIIELWGVLFLFSAVLINYNKAWLRIRKSNSFASRLRLGDVKGVINCGDWWALERERERHSAWKNCIYRACKHQNINNEKKISVLRLLSSIFCR